MRARDVHRVTVTADGDVFAVDRGRRIARLASGWLVDTARLHPDARATGLAARPDGTLAVAEDGWNVLWEIQPSGSVSLLAGVPQLPSLDQRPARRDGDAPEAKLRSPAAICAGPGDSILLSEPDDDRSVLRLLHGGRVRTLDIAGMPPWPISGITCLKTTVYAAPAAFGPPALILIHVSDLNPAASADLRASYAGVVGSDREAGAEDGSAAQARFVAPAAIASTPGHPVAVADGSRLRLIDPHGAVRTLAGSGPGFRDATSLDAAFGCIRAVGVAPDGTVIAADPDNDAIRAVAPDGSVRTVVGAGPSGPLNGADAAVLGRAMSAALVDDDADEAWGIARIFLRDHELRSNPWPDRSLQPITVVSARVGKELAGRWMRSDDPDRAGLGLFCTWLIGCSDREVGVDDLRDRRLTAIGAELLRIVRE